MCMCMHRVCGLLSEFKGCVSPQKNLGRLIYVCACEVLKQVKVVVCHLQTSDAHAVAHVKEV